MWWLLTAYNTSNVQFNETHVLRHKHRRREKRYVVVTQCLIRTSNNSLKTHILKSIDMIEGEKRGMWWLLTA